MRFSPASQGNRPGHPPDDFLLRDVQALGPFRHVLPVEVGVDGPGAHGVDPHPVGSQLQGQRPGQGDHPGLGGIVGRHQGGRALPVDRSHVDDGARLLPLHGVRRRAATVERPGQGHRQHPVPLPVAQLGHLGDRLPRAGVVDQDVDPPPLADKNLEKLPDGPAVGDVHGGGFDLQSLLPQAGSRFPHLFRLHVGHGHVGAPPAQLPGDGQTQPLGGSGDHGIQALQAAFREIGSSIDHDSPSSGKVDGV